MILFCNYSRCIGLHFSARIFGTGYDPNEETLLLRFGSLNL